MNRRTFGSLFRYVCLNWKVVVGLGVVGVGIWLLAPRFLLSALPLLILAACPISMVVMMVGMNKMRQPQQEPTPQLLSAPERADMASWQRLPTGRGMRDERLAEARRQYTRLQTEQETLRAELSRFVTGEPPAQIDATPPLISRASHRGPLASSPNDEPVYATPSSGTP